jgi:hypothetical protein
MVKEVRGIGMLRAPLTVSEEHLARFIHAIRNVVELAHGLHDKKRGGGFRGEAPGLARRVIDI